MIDISVHSIDMVSIVFKVYCIRVHMYVYERSVHLLSDIIVEPCNFLVGEMLHVPPSCMQAEQHVETKGGHHCLSTWFA